MDCREVVAPFSWPLWIVILGSAAFADVGLRFNSSPESICVPPGDGVMFECSLNVTAEQASWRHKGRLLTLNSYPEGSDDELGRLEEGSAWLRRLDLIVLVSREPKQYAEQAGDYQCIASFGALRLASKPAQLTIAEIREFEEKEDENYTVTVGNTVALPCNPPFSNPPAVIEFYHNRTQTNVFRQTALPLGESSLVLPRVTEQDSGVYSCKASNYVKAVYSHHHIHLNVVRAGTSPLELKAPHFLTPPPRSYTAVIGSNVTLQCAPIGQPPPLVKWQKYGGELPMDRAKIIPGGLQLVKISHGDEGTYLCKATNTVGSIPEVIIQLNIEEPPMIVREPVNTDVEEGGQVEMECHAKGLPAPTISWLFNGESVENDSLIKAAEGKLTVYNVQLRHAGIVQCFATNSLGSVFGSAMLRVSPKQLTVNSNGNFAGTDVGNDGILENPLLLPTPSGGRKNGTRKKDRTRKAKGRRKDKKHREAVMVPPSQPNITRLTDESVMVRWEVPENDGLRIQFFKVQYLDMGPGRIAGWNTIDDDIPPYIRSYEVRNLKVNNVYRFRIAAVYSNNDHLLGPNSIRFHMQEPTSKKPPYPPTLTLTEVISPSAIRIEWEFLDLDTVPIEGFFIYYRATTNAGEYTKASANANTRSYIITHLLPSTSYDIQVKAYNSAGASESSSILTAKTLDSELTPVKEDEEPYNRISGTGSDVTTPQTSFSNNSQLYVVLGTVLGGGMVLLLLICLALYNCRQRLSALQGMPPAASDHDDCNEYQMTAASRELGGLNGNGIGNGHTGNGYLPTQAAVNITSNPLSDVDEDQNQDATDSMFAGRRTVNNPVCSRMDAGGLRLQKTVQDVDPEEGASAHSVGNPAAISHQNHSGDVGVGSVKRPSSPSWMRKQKVTGASHEDCV